MKASLSSTWFCSSGDEGFRMLDGICMGFSYPYRPKYCVSEKITQLLATFCTFQVPAPPSPTLGPSAALFRSTGPQSSTLPLQLAIEPTCFGDWSDCSVDAFVTSPSAQLTTPASRRPGGGKRTVSASNRVIFSNTKGLVCRDTRFPCRYHPTRKNSSLAQRDLGRA